MIPMNPQTPACSAATRGLRPSVAEASHIAAATSDCAQATLASLLPDILEGCHEQVLASEKCLKSLEGPIQQAAKIFCTKRLAKNMLESVTQSKALAILCLGQLPFGLSIPAHLIQSAVESLDGLRLRLDQLTDSERASLLHQLPPMLRSPLEKEWKMPRSLRAIACMNQGAKMGYRTLLGLGSSCAAAILPRAGSAVSCLLSPIIPQDKQQVLATGLKAVGNQFCSDVWENTALFLAPAMDPICGSLVKQLAGHSEIVRETLQELDQVIQSLPPRKAANVLFSALVDFSKIQQEGAPSNAATALSTLRRAATKDLLPTRIMSAGLRQLFKRGTNPEAMQNHLQSLLNQTLTGEDFPFPEAQFTEFCQRRGLSEIHPRSLPLVRAAFHLESLPNMPLDMQFLAELVLLDPARCLIHVDQEHAEAHPSLFMPQGLLEMLAIYHVKSTLAPAIEQKCLTREGKLLIQALGKITGRDIRGELHTLLARAFVQKGMGLLTNTHLFAANILSLFIQLPDPLNEFRTSAQLRASAPPRQRQMTKAEQANHRAAHLLIETFEQAAEQMPFFKQLALGSSVAELGPNLINLTQRADWGLYLIYLASHLSDALYAPEDASPLVFTDSERVADLATIASNCLPDVAWILQLPHYFLSSSLQSLDKKLDRLSYSTAIKKTRENIQIGQLTRRLASLLSESTSIEEITGRLKDHIDRMKRKTAPGEVFDRAAYIALLISLSPEDLLGTLSS